MEIGPIIKNPVLDINKLVRQGTLLNQGVQNVEGDSTADQSTVDLLARKDPVIQEISVGMSGDEATLYTVSGTPPLSLPNSLGKPLKAWSVDLLPYQEGTGDPSPDNVRPIHGTDKLTITTAGKNLLDLAILILPSDGNTGNIACNIPAGTYTFAVTVSTNVAWICRIRDANGNNIVTPASQASVAGRQSVTFTITQNASYINVYFNGATTATDFQLEFGSTATTYTPYLAPSQTVITLPSTVYNGTVGSEGGESRWGEVDLGTLTWGVYPVVPGVKVIESGYDDRFSMDNAVTLMCEQYKAVANSIQTAFASANVANTICVIRLGSRPYLAIIDHSFDNATGTEIKTALTGVKLVYKATTPTTFAVPSVTIPTPTGTATTWATAEDGTVDGMEVSYVGKA